MSYTRFTFAAARCWPRLVRPSWFGLVLALTALRALPPAAVAQPPSSHSVDEIRAAFRYNLGTILEQSLDLSISQDRMVQKEAELNGVLERDRKKVQDELNALDTKIADQDKTLKGTLNARAERIDKALKDAFAQADASEQVALAYLIGEEARRVRYPLYAVLPDLLDRMHPETGRLIALTEAAPGRPTEVRQAAAVALGKSSGEPKRVVPALAKLLLDRDNPQPLRLTAAEALDRPIQLIRNPPATRPADKAFKRGTVLPEKDKDAGADLALVLRETGARSLPVLIQGMQDNAGAVRLASVKGVKAISSALLGQVPGPPLPETDPGKYRQAELETARRTRQFLLESEYGKLLREFREQMPDLLLGIDDADAEVRSQTLSILEDLATIRLLIAEKLTLEKSVELVPPPDQGMAAPSPAGVVPVSFGAREAPAPAPAGNQDPLPAALRIALRRLPKALKDPDPRTRRAAAAVLEAIGDESAGEIPTMLDGLSDQDRFVRWTLLRALGRLAPRDAKHVVPVVAAHLQEPDFDVRLAAITTVERYGQDAGAAVPALTELLPRGDATVRLAALKALQAIGVEATPSLPEVARLLEHPDPSVRIGAADTLGRFGKNAAQSRPALERALNDPDDNVRQAIGEAILRLRK